MYRYTIVHFFQVFLVFAQLPTRNYLGEMENQMTAFLVDREHGGIEISQPYELAGYNGLQVCDVVFNSKVPVNGLLGTEGEGLVVLQSLLHQNKYFMAAGVLRRLKTLLNMTVEHVLARKQYGQKLSGTRYCIIFAFLTINNKDYRITRKILLVSNYQAVFRIRIHLDPNSIGRLDPDPHSECGYGSRRYKKS
jgi:hypothetical protein